MIPNWSEVGVHKFYDKFYGKGSLTTKVLPKRLQLATLN